MSSNSSALDVGEAPDFIIVGGGTAGLVVANRLSEDPSVRVLVIEAGAHHKGDPNVDIPGLMTQLYGQDKYDWKFMTTPQVRHDSLYYTADTLANRCQDALNGRQIACPRGKMLGGSSGMNFCAIIYPSSGDFDAWTKLGNKGWSSSEMEQYFRKFQTHYPPAEEVSGRMQLHNCVDTKIKRHDGPVPISYLNGYGKSHQAWIEAFAGLGFDVPGDPIHGKKLGGFTNPVSIHPETQTRGYSASTYYNEKAAARPNLQVLTETLVNRVIVEKKSDGSAVANSVEVRSKDGKAYTIPLKPGGEVVISAGVVKSPQILELSGIGNEDILRRHNIPVLVSNPNVGENLQDHPLSAVSFEVADPMESGDVMRDPVNQVAAFTAYQTSKSGPLAGAALTFAYLPLVDKDGRVGATEIQKLLNSHPQNEKDAALHPEHKILEDLVANEHESTGEYMLLPMQLNENTTGPTEMSTLFTPRTPGNYISFVAMLNRPFSRGTTHIRSANSTEYPDYDPKYMSSPLDLELMARHTQFLENIANTGPMSKILKPNGRRIPDYATDLRDLNVAKRVAVDQCFTAFHPCGTCAMKPREQGGVVSDRLLVHGTQNLRVVDASIFPMIPVGNIQALVYASAERAADLIKADWAVKKRV